MHAMKVDVGERLVWSEVPEPEPKPDEVLIEVHAAALNRADLMQRAGQYPSPDGWPPWMGLEVAGLVRRAPMDSRFHPGDAVCALLGGGGYAERVAVPAGLVLPIPNGISMVEAAAIPEAFATAWLNLCFEAGMKAKDRVLIHAGASGLGMAAIQLAKFFKAEVMTTVSSAPKADFVRSLGADHVVIHRNEDLAVAMERHPIDIALDCVAGPSLGRCVEKMARGGRWIVIATLGGAKTELDMNLFFRQGLKLIGSTLRSRSLETKARILADMEGVLWEHFATGALRSIVYKTLPMSQAEGAHAILQSQQNLGKVVLTLKEDRRAV